VGYSTSNYYLIPYNYDGSAVPTSVAVPSDLSGAYASSWDFKEFWGAPARKGLTSRKYDNGTWTVTREPMRPNAPACYLSVFHNMAYSPTYGVLATNHGVSRYYANYDKANNRNLLSGLKNGVWSVYSPVYTAPTYSNVSNSPNGCCIDIDNGNYVYFGSWYNGIARLNLEDPNDVLHMACPADQAASLDSYQKLDDNDPGWNGFFYFHAPKFDSKGNLWSMHYLVSGDLYLFVWPADKRRASDVSGWSKFRILPGISTNYTSDFWPLKSEANKNLIVISAGNYGGTLYVYDTNGTPEDSSDDKYVTMTQLYDEDGSSITREYVLNVYEDQSTGKVWVGYEGGVFTFDPKAAFNDPSSVQRIKISRNDGTSTADYLLDGAHVMNITSDASGNKWFATRGGGLVETTSSGHTVLRQLLSSNSYLPDDAVLDLCYNPDNNSIVVSTVKGYAEYFIPGSSTGTDFDAVKVYPNPVRPDYTGWITIEGLIDNALIKIVDAQGTIVKELGSSVGGVIQWDGTNMSNTKVNSGVYYVCMSSATEGVSEANVAKILVVK
jgi:hypothetical protein